MAIQMRNKRNLTFNMASMSDLVFLLLIFFMLTSTLIAPNAIKLLLPSSESRTMAKQTVTVYLNEDYQMFLEETPVTTDELHSGLLQLLANEEEGSVVLRADQSVPVQYIVNVIDVVNNINNANQSRHKVILATQPAP
ncbi:MAG: biopolymer transporter ExbD [Bacteroides sp.]|jgi:biopolymer transport protein ExbD|nr:biopolymer transporter ExbD [Bacteroides sp.]